MGKKSYLLFFACFLFISCAGTGQKSARSFIAQYGSIDPTPSRFKVCFSHGCQRSMEVSLNTEQWARIRQTFQPPAVSASLERKNIAQAISLLESMAGSLTGTDVDIGGSFEGTFKAGQMDCEDEAVNTSTYLAMLEKDGLIFHHEFYQPASRGFFINGWPHMATVIVEKRTSKKYVVDSWFLDNGKPPFILPYKVWKAGWKPDL